MKTKTIIIISVLAVLLACLCTIPTINRIKEKERISIESAIKNGEEAQKARDKAYEPIEKWEKENITIDENINPVENN